MIKTQIERGMNILFWPLQPFVNKREKDATFVLDQPALQILMWRKLSATLTGINTFFCVTVKLSLRVHFLNRSVQWSWVFNKKRFCLFFRRIIFNRFHCFLKTAIKVISLVWNSNFHIRQQRPKTFHILQCPKYYLFLGCESQSEKRWMIYLGWNQAAR